MTFPVWLEIVCRNCSNSVAGQYTFKGNVPVRAMKSEAKARGWIFNYNEAFCCKYCVQAYEKEIGLQP